LAKPLAVRNIGIQARPLTPQSDELLRLMFDSRNDYYAILLLDAEGKIVNSSRVGKRMNLLRVEESVGKHFEIFYPPEEVRLRRPQKLLEEAIAGGQTDDEGWLLRGDGSQFWARIVITALRDQNGALRGFGGLVSDQVLSQRAEGTPPSLREVRDRRVKERTNQLGPTNRELAESLSQTRALAARLQAVREKERRVMAREIHDNLGQTLTAMNMDLVWLIQRLPGAETSLQVRVNSLLQRVDTAILWGRKMAAESRPGILDHFGLSAALEWLAQDFQARTGIKCKVVLPVADVLLDDESSTGVFRICEETLTNVAHHAAATRVVVKVTKDRQFLVFEVLDNGRGFVQAAIIPEKSLGLLAMKERARTFGGTFAIRSDPGKGTSATIRVPFAKTRTIGEIAR
jgi:PAS domain S-box-containing protein